MNTILKTGFSTISNKLLNSGVAYAHTEYGNDYVDHMPFMHHGYGTYGGYSLVGIIIGIAIVVFLGAGAYYFIKKANKH